MLEQFTFQYHTLEVILNHLDHFVKGTLMCDIIMYDEKLKKPVMKTKSNMVSNPEIDVVNYLPYADKIAGLMSYSPGHYWHIYKELSWREINHENLNLTLFIKPNILQVTLENDSKSGLNDVILFYFPSNLTNFRMADSKGGKDITEAEQTIIGKLIHSGILGIGAGCNSDWKNWNEISTHYKQQELEILRLRAENEKILTSFSNSILKYCQHQLDKIAKDSDTELAFSEELIQELKTLREVPLSIYDDIKRAIRISSLKATKNAKKPLVISVTDLKITEDEETEIKVEDQIIEIHMRAPYSFLERIENAMQLLDYQRKPFTGENVGAHMNPTITKSAITQYRNSHQKDIIQLLLLHQDKWMLTRNHFKPIKNLLDNQEIGKKNKRSAND